jgi:DNA-binding MarR family transcriptional regulator
MTRLVDAMEADGLVAREPHPTDGRSTIIRIAAAGEAALASGRATQTASLAEALARLDGGGRRDLEAAVELLGRVLREGR